MNASRFEMGSNVLRITVFFLSLLLMGALAGEARAEDSLAPLRAFWSNKLPNTTQLRKEYSNLSTTPFGREDLALSLLVPSDWKDTKVTVKTEQLEKDSENWIPLTTQLSPEGGEGEAAIQVGYIRLDLEMGLRDYMDQHVEANRYSVLLRRQGVYNNRQVEEVLVRSNGQIARITFSRHGDRIFAVVCSSPSSEYERHAMSFAAAAVSFGLKKEDPSRSFAGTMASYSSTESPRLEFRYPDFWEMEPVKGQPAGQSGIEIRMAVPDEKGGEATLGYIYVQGYDKSAAKTPTAILGEVRKALEAKPVAFDEKILSADLVPGQGAGLFRLERYKASVEGAPAEAATLIIPRGSDLLAMSLVVPPKKSNLLAWMHCWRVFEIAASDLADKELPIAQVKSLTLPAENQLAALVSETMGSFSGAVEKWDFTELFNSTSRLFQIQSTASRLRSAFAGFDRHSEIPAIPQHNPVFTRNAFIDQEGLLQVEGHFPTAPQATNFALTYLYEDAQWKLLGINITMGKGKN